MEGSKACELVSKAIKELKSKTGLWANPEISNRKKPIPTPKPYGGSPGARLTRVSLELWKRQGEEITVAFPFSGPSNLPPLLAVDPTKHEAADMEAWEAQLIYLGVHLLSGVPPSTIIAFRCS